MTAMRDYLATRRTVPAAFLEGPGPDAATLRTMLTMAARVPDHGKLSPWRFIVFDGDARAAAGEAIAAVVLARERVAQTGAPADAAPAATAMAQEAARQAVSPSNEFAKADKAAFDGRSVKMTNGASFDGRAEQMTLIRPGSEAGPADAALPGRGPVDVGQTSAADEPAAGDVAAPRDVAGVRAGRPGGSVAGAAPPSAATRDPAEERARFTRAPLVVAVVSRAGPHAKIPEWEQVLSAGAVCVNLLHAAAAHGYSGQWLTEWIAYDDSAKAALGIAADEKVAGFIHIGLPSTRVGDRDRPDLDAIVTRFADHPVTA